MTTRPAVQSRPRHAAAHVTTLRTDALIGGSWRTLSRTFEVTDPYTQEVIARVADCGEGEAAEAVDMGARAFEIWKRTTAYERATTLRRWFDLIIAHQDELAELMALEMGKPVAEARGEVRYAAGFVEFFAEEAKRTYGDTIPSRFAHKRLITNRKPVGVAFCITPWNFPAAMVTRKVAPALAAGCVVILKPAEQTPLTALRLAELWLNAGGPEGTLQVVPCQDPVPVARVVMDDPRVRKLSFTGSTDVGMRLYAQAARTMKRVSLELGGHAPFLVFRDADVERAAREVAASKFRNAGQTCVCANRVYVHNEVHDHFVERFTDLTRSLRVGDPLDEQTQIGPLVDGAALQKVAAHVGDARAQGAYVLTGGEGHDGTFFAPTVLTNVTPNMRIMMEETFGPVAPIVSFCDEADAIRQANATSAGLAAYLWTSDLGRAFRVSEALDYGIVGVNDGLPATPQAPFGGVKNSGIGREGGRWGIDEYLDVQYVSIALQ